MIDLKKDEENLSSLTCLSILIIGGGFITYKLILGSLSSGLGGLSSLFG